MEGNSVCAIRWVPGLCKALEFSRCGGMGVGSWTRRHFDVSFPHVKSVNTSAEPLAKEGVIHMVVNFGSLVK